jgi:hypothetical protein
MRRFPASAQGFKALWGVSSTLGAHLGSPPCGSLPLSAGRHAANGKASPHDWLKASSRHCAGLPTDPACTRHVALSGQPHRPRPVRASPPVGYGP